MGDTLREKKICDICGSQDVLVIYKWRKQYYSHLEFNTQSWDACQNVSPQIVMCNQCGLVFSYPSFKKEKLSLIYDDIAIKTINLPSLLKSTKWDDIIALLSDLLPLGSVICDIGTKYGPLPYQLLLKGYDSFGIEISKPIAQAAKKAGLPVFCGDISSLKKVLNEKKIGSVDSFIMDDVLEHLVNPSSDIKLLNSNQKIGGCLILRQMNYSSLGRKIFGRNWYYFQPAAHMYYFEEKSIKNLLYNCGYRVQQIVYPSKWKVFRSLCAFPFLLMLKKRALNKVKGNKNYLLTRNKLSDIFMVVAIKERDVL